MARVHLYKGVYQGPKVTFNTCVYNFEAAGAGDYDQVKTGESTLPTTGEPIKLIRFHVTSQGIDKLIGYNRNDAILPPFMIVQNGDQVDAMACNTKFTQVQVGVKPDDWELRWRDKYYTFSHATQNGVPYNYPTPASSTWSSTTQYYTPMSGYEPQIQYFSDSLLYFGIGQCFGLWETQYIRDYTNILERGVPCIGVNNFENTFWWKAPGINGTSIGSASGYGIQHIQARTLRLENYTSPHITQLISFNYDGQDYIGVVFIIIGVDNIPTQAHVTAIGAEAFRGESGGGYDGPISEPGGGDGTFHDDSDTIRKRGANGNIASTLHGGGYHVYSLDGAELSQFFNAAFSTSFWDSFSDRMEAITKGVIDCYLLPYGPGETYPSSQIRLCGESLANTSGEEIAMSQVWINFGVLDIPRYYDTFLDFAPNSSATIFLPFIGTFELPVNEIVGGQVQCYYIQDFLTGDITAFVECLNQFGDNHLIGQFTGNAKYTLPVVAGQQNMAGWIAAAGATAGLVGGAIGGAKAGAALGSIVPGVGNAVGGAIGAAVGGTIGAIPGLVKAAEATPVTASVVTKMTGGQGWTGYEVPYISITRTMYDQPETFARDKGYTSNISSKIGDLSLNSFNVVSNFNANNITNANDAERAEILKILTSGFYV